jgi:uncharacterized membrane protein
MIRKHLIGSHTVGESGFRWRGHEVTRLEGFTDAVFAFAVTLLVVSLEVPKTFPELLEAMHGFIVFGICFTLLAYVWFMHYRFFRRYGLENPWTVILNCALLFFVLFYVYPLKFLFTAAFSDQQFSLAEGRMLYGIFSVGYAAVFSVFALLYWHAWRFRAELELDPIETLRTRQSLIDQMALAGIGLFSALLSQILPPRELQLAGIVYFAVPLYFTWSGHHWGKRERLLRA